MTKHYSRKVWTLIVITAVIAAGAAVCTFAFRKQEPPKPHVRHRPGKKVLQNLLENMVRVEGGAYVMGATAEQGSDAFESEKPGHMVEVKSFYICRFEVTQAEWEVVMGYNPSGFKSEQHPVENVSWEDCQRFISKLSAITGRLFRLPTEVEWEYAARGGKLSCGYKYSGGNEIDSLAWYEENSERHSHLIGQKEPNELGLFDMSGNVWEWCQDVYAPYPSGTGEQLTWTPPTGNFRVLRGGSWFSDARDCRVSFRNYYTPGHRVANLGFRLAI